MTASDQSTTHVDGAAAARFNRSVLYGLPALSRCGKPQVVNGHVFRGGETVVGFHALHGLNARDARAPPCIFNGVADMGKYIFSLRAADEFILEPKACVAVAPSGNAWQFAQRRIAPKRMSLCKARRCQDHCTSAIGDLAAVLASGTRFNHRVGLVIVREAQFINGAQSPKRLSDAIDSQERSAHDAAPSSRATGSTTGRLGAHGLARHASHRCWTTPWGTR